MTQICQCWEVLKMSETVCSIKMPVVISAYCSLKYVFWFLHTYVYSEYACLYLYTVSGMALGFLGCVGCQIALPLKYSFLVNYDMFCFKALG